jgi:hydrogenase large subunit
MATITVMDPVTRIEGHMKVEVTIDQVGGRDEIVEARCSGTLFRGFENILVGRDPQDAPIITPRICGVCPVSHGLASVMALDAAVGRTVPADARRLRNLTLGANYLQSHILHFYLLAAPDFVKGPAASPWTAAWDVDMRPGAEKIMEHLPLAIEARRRAHEMGAVFGGKMPAPHTFVPGGFTAVPKQETIALFRRHLAWLTGFINNVYLPDAETLASVYDDYFGLGRGWGNLISYGVFDQNAAGRRKLFRAGWVDAASPGTVKPLAQKLIRESVASSHYGPAAENLRPARGVTHPVYDKPGAYTWLKAARYGGQPAEAGPLARMWVNGDYRHGVSAMDRHLARAREARKLAGAMAGWLDTLVPGSRVFGGWSTPSNAAGVGLTEAARGALGHWVRIVNGKIAGYQVITPTCWNASPRDATGRPGPIEKALVGTPVADPLRPVEALRIIHSFDPCLACAVHVIRPGKPPVVIRAGGR